MPKKVADWLRGLGLSQYADAFEENTIGWPELVNLDHDVLKEIGVTAAGHRLRLLRAIKAIARALSRRLA